MDWAMTTAWGYKKHLSFEISCDLYKRFYSNSINLQPYVQIYVCVPHDPVSQDVFSIWQANFISY